MIVLDVHIEMLYALTVCVYYIADTDCLDR